MESKRTLVLGATPNTSRVAYAAMGRLQNAGHGFVPVGIKRGEVFGKTIINDKGTQVGEIDTITLYIGARHQPEWYDYILNLKPKRIIFNPGTENPELKAKAQEQGIETLNSCTLVMLSMGNY